MSIPFYLAIGFFGINFIFYAKALQFFNISIAYPIVVGMSIVLILILSFIFLNEHLSFFQFSGILFVITGVIMIYFK